MVGKETASAAEGLAYFLQRAKLATIVGERTWGGGNPATSVRLSDHFAVIPNGKSVCPIDGGSWEKVGVQPDVACTSGESIHRGTRRGTDSPDRDRRGRSKRKNSNAYATS